MNAVFSTNANQLEAFSDGVLAVIITIMVLDLRLPPGPASGALRSSMPTLGAYALSFLYVGIYWNNHHHMLRAARNIDGRVMWLNLHLLFWLSPIPFAARWLGAYPTASVPYGTLCRVALGLSDRLPALTAYARQFERARFSVRACKGKSTLAICAAAMGFAFLSPWFAMPLCSSPRSFGFSRTGGCSA